MPYNLADILEPEETVAPELMASDMIREKRMKSVAGKKCFTRLYGMRINRVIYLSYHTLALYVLEHPTIIY